MNEELQNKVFNWVSQTADKIGEWGGKEIPSFITEFLTWRFYENLINISASIALIVGGLLVIFKLLLPLTKKILAGRDSEFAPFPIGGIIMIVGLCLAIFPIKQIQDCIKIKVAPKVYLIEEAAKLIK